jgi:hypothetical protein
MDGQDIAGYKTKKEILYQLIITKVQTLCGKNIGNYFFFEVNMFLGS